MSSPFILEENNWASIRKTNFQLPMLPWGATEAHNFHLPYGTDTFQSRNIATEAARIAWNEGTHCIVLPAVPFGVNSGQLDIPLTIHINPSTQAALLEDIVCSLERQGFDRLLILNSHGGNDFVPMIRELQAKKQDFLICTMNWWKLAEPEMIFEEVGDHAGELETSIMMHLHPELVLPLEQAGNGKARPFALKALREGLAWTPRNWKRSTDDTGVGNPKASTAEKGRLYLETLYEVIADVLVELSNCDLSELYEGEKPESG